MSYEIAGISCAVRVICVFFLFDMRKSRWAGTWIMLPWMRGVGQMPTSDTMWWECELRVRWDILSCLCYTVSLVLESTLYMRITYSVGVVWLRNKGPRLLRDPRERTVDRLCKTSLQAQRGSARVRRADGCGSMLLCTPVSDDIVGPGVPRERPVVCQTPPCDGRDLHLPPHSACAPSRS